ncbi:MAG: GFA family protein [Dehalococcoidia bacterium]
MPLRGSCLCGAVRYEIDGSFQLIGNCHCSMCRKSNGAAFATWGIVRSEQFRWTAGQELVQTYESSPGNRRGFCRNCGSPLVSMHSGKVGEVVLGSLDDDPGLRPREHIFVGSKAPWYDIADALPQSAEWPAAMQP